MISAGLQARSPAAAGPQAVPGHEPGPDSDQGTQPEQGEHGASPWDR